MADLVFPDVSEWQGLPQFTGMAAVVIRAHNGYRPDNSFERNREAAHAAGCRIIGIYQYMLGNADPGEGTPDNKGQARLLLDTVGALQAGEFLICDLEEAATDTSDEQPRYLAWRSVASTVSPVTWLYSGLDFSQAHGLNPEWLAAYQNTEPNTGHIVWQNTDAYHWPWGFSDASIYHGTVDQLIELVFPPPPTPAPTPVPAAKEHDVYLFQNATTGAVIAIVGGFRFLVDNTADSKAMQAKAAVLTVVSDPQFKLILGA
jgi:Glycosyl hydrolases family 25